MLQLLRDELTGCIGCGRLSLQHAAWPIRRRPRRTRRRPDALGVSDKKGTRGSAGRPATKRLNPSVPIFLPDRDGFAALDAFHRALEGQCRAPCAYRLEA